MPVHRTHHVFFSYSRKDDVSPVNAEGEGWVTAFERELKRRHRAYSGRELEIFFDRQAIVEGTDWRRRLGEGIRTSRLFLAFLSPNYITSKNCLWEWEEYLRREHSAARGDDGITPIFFVTPRDLTAGQDQKLADWLADLHRRNRTATCELQPWFDHGPEILKQLDAAERSEQVKAAGRDPAHDLRTLGERLAALDRHIAARLDRIALADLAPGNIARSHEHFVGRHRELSDLHTIMVTGGPQSGGRGMGGRGLIAAAHSPGGLGKTALARQYAHAYAEFYAAGGTWEIPCEGVTTLGAALLKLTDDAQFRRLGTEIGQPLMLTDAQREDFTLAAAAVLDHLRVLTQKRVAILREELKTHPEHHSPDAGLPVIGRSRALLVLDNVDQPALLAAAQVAQLPAEEWLEVIVTTRMDPDRFGGGDRTFAHVEVDVLPENDALHLLRDFQPGHAFPNAAEDAAALGIVRALGGYTLAVELVAAYLGDRAKQSYPPSDLLHELQEHGLAWVDSFADRDFVDKDVRHGEGKDAAEKKRQNRVATLIGWSLARLSPPARTALEFASLLLPDAIPMPWLRDLTCQRHPEVATATPADDHCWPSLWRELHGLRLLHPARPVEVDDRGIPQVPETVRLHRLVAEHVAGADAQADRTWAELDKFFLALCYRFQEEVGQGEDAALRAQHPWLRDQLEHLIAPAEKKGAARPSTPTLLQSALVAADFEGRHNSLARALDLTGRILTAQEKVLADNPTSAQAARDVSVSLNKLADFLASRGQAGDAAKALGYYERSLAVREQLLAANPDSAEARRDMLVSLERMAAAEGGRAGGEAAALALQTRSLEIALQLREQNPQSFFYQRTAAVSFFLTYQRAQAAGNQELVVQSLSGCFSVLDGLVQAQVELDPPMRQLHAQLKPMFSQPR